MLQALVVVLYYYQLRAVALHTGGYLHLVLLRAYCCCCQLRAAGRAYWYLLLVQNQSARATYDYLYCDTPAPLFLAIKTRSARKYNFHQSETACDTNGHVPTKKHEIPPHPEHPRLKKHLLSQKSHVPASCYDKHKR